MRNCVRRNRTRMQLEPQINNYTTVLQLAHGIW
jgi:hypothetical protein